MNIEKKRIELCTSGGDNTFGRIELDKCAIPETVRVFLCGEPIIPDSFDCFGQPIFTEEQGLTFMYQEDDLTRRNGGEYSRLKAEVIYEERPFTADRKSFDTAAGIRKSLSNLKDFNEMLDNRRVFHKLNQSGGDKLHEFLVFGNYYLDQFGQVMELCSEDRGKLRTRSDAEAMESMWKRNAKKRVSFGMGSYAIPREGDKCPCCGKTFTIEDIKNNPMVRRNGKIYHETCWKKYRKLKEIDKFTRLMVGILYKDSDYTYELIPNRYWGGDCEEIPWFLFHTIDGDIIMGWRKRVISIEWQANYKPFNFEETFQSEDVTKWEEGGRRGIHAWGRDDAYKYLKTVLGIVNPGYSRH